MATLAVIALVGVPTFVLRRILRGRRDLGGPVDRATFETLHTASLAAPPLRSGLTAQGTEKAARHLRALLGQAALAITNAEELLAWEGAGGHHAEAVLAHAEETLSSGR